MRARSSLRERVPRKLRAKTEISGKPQNKKLDKSKDCLAAQAKSPVGAQIAAEATALEKARSALVAKNQELTDLVAAVTNKQIEVLIAEGEHDTALDTYARRAAIIAKDDPSVLNGLGVEAAATHYRPPAEGPAEAPTNVRLLPGEESGSANVKWKRAPGVGAFLAQYKLEPTANSAAPSEWSPQEGFATRKASWVIENLPPAAQLRVRVRAIGAEIGPWSEEVLGRAR